MRKVMIGLFAILMCAGYSLGQSKDVPQWKVVKEFHVIGGSSKVPLTPFLKVSKNTLYRVSLYISGAAPKTQDGGWQTIVLWTDRNGGEAVESASITFSQNTNPYTGLATYTFSPKVGTVMEMEVSLILPVAPGATYDTGFTIEALTR